MHLPRALKPPPSDADPLETFRWIRRCEIAIAPVGGASSLLRKAERDPSVFVSDPERRRERAKRFLIFFVPLFVISGAIIGFFMDGWGAAVFMGVLMASGAGLGAWTTVRRLRDS